MEVGGRLLEGGSPLGGGEKAVCLADKIHGRQRGAQCTFCTSIHRAAMENGSTRWNQAKSFSPALCFITRHTCADGIEHGKLKIHKNMVRWNLYQYRWKAVPLRRLWVSICLRLMFTTPSVMEAYRHSYTRGLIWCEVSRTKMDCVMFWLVVRAA